MVDKNYKTAQRSDKSNKPEIKIESGHPWNFLEHYHEEIGACRTYKGSNLIRHNFVAIRTSEGITLKCMHCDAVTSLQNEDLDLSSKLERIKIWQEDQNKGPDDITIYRIYWRKDKSRITPGFSYVGKSSLTSEKRVYGPVGSGSHFYQAFYNPRISMDRTIRNYARTLGIAMNTENYKDLRLRDYFKVEALKVVKFQGNREQINSIQDVNLRQEALDDAKAKTTELANYYEKFFIGFYHSQFQEFGRNVAQGGDFGAQTGFLPIDFAKIDAAFKEVMFLSHKSAPYVAFADLIYPGVNFKNKESTLTNSLIAQLGNEIRPFQTEWRNRQEAYIKEKFEEGYTTSAIAKIMNDYARRELGKYFKEPISTWGINIRVRDIYSDRNFPADLAPRSIRKIILKERIMLLYDQGYTSYDTLLPHFPAFKTSRSLKEFMVSNYAGLKGLSRDSLSLISTDNFLRTVELIRNYEENEIEYTEGSLWKEIFSTEHPHFYKKFGLNIEELKVFAITGRLPQRLIQHLPYDGGGIGDPPRKSFRLSKYYNEDLIEQIMNEIVIPREENLKKGKRRTVIIDAEYNRGIPQTGKFPGEASRRIWLTEQDFEHILAGQESRPSRFGRFGISIDPDTIGNLIMQAIKGYPVAKTEEGSFPGAKIYIYAIRRPGGSGYLHILVDPDGHVVTVYSSEFLKDKGTYV